MPSIFDLMGQGQKIADAEPQLIKDTQTMLADLQLGLKAAQKLITDVQAALSSITPTSS